ncbi:MAG: site-2 protease family protein [Planctomycetaceae bacterium]
MAQIHGLVTHRQTIQEMVGYSSAIERIVTWPIMLILKVFRISLPNISSDHPPVDRLSDLEVTEAEFPRTAQQKIEPLLAGLAELGFEPALRYAVHLPNQQTELYQVYLRHRSGKMIAQITYRHWYQQGRQRLFTSFLSAEKSGQAVLTTNGRLDSLLWPMIHVVRKVDEPIDKLLERHEQAVQTQGLSPLQITSDVQIREIVEHLHEKNRQYQLERGTYAPLRADSPQAERLAELPPRKPPADTGSGEIDEFLVDEIEFEEVDSEPVQDGVTREIVRLMEAEAVKSTSWTQNILLLLVSLGVFIAVSRGQNDWSWTLLLIPVLLIHELGHLLVMRACGYRNTKIFFIPFFGAAASGINFNVPGWKRILVALAGPLPGLAFGGLAGVAGVMYQQPLLIKFGVISGILNLFNLLPVLPLDGGWVAFHILFCRHPLLDAAFRTCGALAMGLLAIVTRQVALGILAFFILMGAIRAFKIGDVARRLRDEGIKPASEDDPGIDHALAVRVASGIRRAFASTPKLTTQVLSAAALEAYSLLHARPPRLLGSLFFGAVQLRQFFRRRPSG